MEIKTFDDIIEKHQLSKETLKGIEERLCAMANMEKFSFTALQKEAFNTYGYWRGDLKEEARHVVVQGATSSGKTLVSEIAILDCLKSRKKSIVLVPLKAMVRERCEYLQRDLKPLGTKQIYASSSDFKDHDGEIVNGDYEVAVIVYEKFFAMLSQSSCNMLNNCALLVVDELQMLSSLNRGPKLEIGIQKVLRKNDNLTRNAIYTRIMCLTTCDCKVTNIMRWLSTTNNGIVTSPILIRKTERPIGLKEHVIQMDGTWKMRYICGEHDKTMPQKDESGKIDVVGYDSDNKVYQAKKLLLKSLLQKIFQENPKAKVLIFANGRKRTRDIAVFIAQQGILPYEKIPPEMKKINEYEDDEYQNTLKETLLPRKIAFHNAALSVALREFTEDIFEKEDCLRVVAATETLTIGMNMPVDVMILFDSEVHRGNGSESEALTSQEYKNFVGRAGRLGQTNHVGESYIFASTKTDADSYWDKYVNCRTEEIISALAEFGEKEHAPYYLSLMETSSNELYDDVGLKKLWEESFSKKCNGKSIDMKKVVRELKKASLCKISIVDEEEDEEEIDKNGEKVEQYQLSNYGKMMAPYAFELATCKKIRRYFFNGGFKKVNGKWQEKLESGKGGIPATITDKDIENDRYLLDILYVLCCTEEISGLSQLKLPSVDKNPEKSREALDKIEAALRRFILPSDGEKAICDVWPESPLMYMLENGYNDEIADKQCIMRAILLWHWTKGEPISEIRKNTGFDSFVSIVNGDIARMAEAVSYQLEAIHRCYGGYNEHIKMNAKTMKSLYNLSTRINYGMPRNLVIIANRHLHGLDRKIVLQIGEEAKKNGKYDSPVNFLKEASAEELQGIITEQQRSLLLQKIEELYLRDSLSILLDSIQKNAPNMQLSEEERSSIEALYGINSETESEGLLTPLGNIFFTEDYLIQNPNCEGSRFFQLNGHMRFVANANIAVIYLETIEFAIGYYAGRAEVDKQIDRFFSQKESKRKNILLVKDESVLKNIQPSGKCHKWELFDDEQQKVFCHIHLAMTFKIFSELIAQDVALDDRKAAALGAMLKDTYGVFHSAGLQALRPFLQNYDKDHDTNTTQYPRKNASSLPVLRILCDKRLGLGNQIFGIPSELSRTGIPYRVLQWGEELRKEQPADAPILIILTWDTVKSSLSLYEFCEDLRKNHYKNTLAIFDSKELFLKWGTDNEKLPCNELLYCTKEIGMNEIIQKIKGIMNCYKNNNFVIGVSYAHEKEIGEDRADVLQLYEIIKNINNALGESSVLFDKNPSCQNRFDGNGALPETLELYKQCEYYIVLDDHFYDKSEYCKREKEVISKRLDEINPGHLWFLHPDNDEHCSLYSEDLDFSTRMDLTESNTVTISNAIIAKVKQGINRNLE